MIFDWPKTSDWAPYSGRMALVPISQHSRSPYTGAAKVNSLTQIWRAELAFNPKSISVANNILGFIDGLEGGANPVRIFDYSRTKPQLLGGFTWTDGTTWDDGLGWLDGWAATVLNAQSAGDKTVVLQGLPPLQACFSRGDLFQLNDALYEVRYDAFSNAAGQAMLSILPGLRTAAAPSDPVNLWYPTVPMRLENYAGAITRNRVAQEPFSLSFVEDIAA